MHTKTEHILAQLETGLILTDGGLETDLIFNHGIDLPHFASFDLLSTGWGRQALVDYYLRYLELARQYGSGFLLETPTWRASRDWGERMGYSPQDIRGANIDAVTLLRELAAQYSDLSPLLVSGNIGPRGDGYRVEGQMSAEQARDYHGEQVAAFAEAGVDMVSAFTLNYIAEAEGIALAAQAAGLPVVLSFTVETDGRLPSGDALGDAIDRVDALTGGYPAYYMINCAHPSHFSSVLEAGGAGWPGRIRGVRGNASRCSHAELDAAETLDDGNPQEFGEEYRHLRQLLPGLQVVGGCCGTDHRHVERIAAACCG